MTQATNLVHRSWEASDQTGHYRARYRFNPGGLGAAGDPVLWAGGLAMTMARTGLGLYTLTIDTPAGLADPVKFLGCWIKEIPGIEGTPGVVADAIKKWVVLSLNDTTRSVDLAHTEALAAGPAVVADPEDDDEMCIVVSTYGLLDSQ